MIDICNLEFTGKILNPVLRVKKNAYLWQTMGELDNEVEVNRGLVGKEK